MVASLRHFLIVFDHDQGRFAQDVEVFDTAAAATDAYTATEAEYSANDRIEVVLIGSDSLETVKQTHPNYFAPHGGPDALELLRQEFGVG